MLRVLRLLAPLFLLGCTGFAHCAGADDRPVLTVFAAASLTDVLQRIAPEFTRESGVRVRFSFAASSSLARQIESGARADVFFSADPQWMDYLDARGLIDRATRRDLLHARLVLIALRDSTVQIDLERNPASVLSALGRQGRLAVGDPDFVPAGKYAQAALTNLGMWREVAPRLARADNVRAALMYVARGEAPLGVVYEPDALVEPRVRIVAVFPARSHPPITYPVAPVSTASGQARAFIQFLEGAFASEVFVGAGFTVESASR